MVIFNKLSRCSKFSYYNGKPWILQWDKNWKFWNLLFDQNNKSIWVQKSLKVREHTPPNVAILLFFVCFGPILIYYPGPKVNYFCFCFCPILKFRASYCNTKTFCAGWVYLNKQFFLDILLAYDHTQCLPFWVSHKLQLWDF